MGFLGSEGDPKGDQWVMRHPKRVMGMMVIGAIDKDLAFDDFKRAAQLFSHENKFIYTK